MRREESGTGSVHLWVCYVGEICAFWGFLYILLALSVSLLSAFSLLLVHERDGYVGFGVAWNRFMMKVMMMCYAR